MHDDDPYETTFVVVCGGALDKTKQLTETQWRTVLSMLVDTHLLHRATAARFTTDYHGLRSLEGFQDQLVRWSLPETDPLRSLEEALTTLEENTALVERMTAASLSTTPAFIANVLVRVQAIADDLEQSETACRRQLAAHTRQTRLFGQSSPNHTTASVHAWQFQRDHQAFVQREERRRRPVRVERHATDGTSRQVLLETFPLRLSLARDLSVTMASTTVADIDPANSTESPSTKTELVVAIAMQRQRTRADEVEWLETLIAAYRELQLSPYFQQYLGCYETTVGDRSGGNSEQLYCFEFAPVTPLEQLLRTNEALFVPDAPIVRYLAREILLAMVDLLDQSTHEWKTRLTPANILLSVSRRRVLIGKMEFGSSIDILFRHTEPLGPLLLRREAVLLNDLALLLFAMLYCTTLPTNLQALRSQYLTRCDAFTSEYLVTAVDVSTVRTLRVCRGDRFVLRFVTLDTTPWLLKGQSPRLSIQEQQSTPVSSFTFIATDAGDHRLEFTTSTARVTVCVQVTSQSYQYDPPSQWTTLIETCARASPSVSLRQILDHHALFQPLTTTIDVAALDTALDQCTNTA